MKNACCCNEKCMFSIRQGQCRVSIGSVANVSGGCTPFTNVQMCSSPLEMTTPGTRTRYSATMEGGGEENNTANAPLVVG